MMNASEKEEKPMEDNLIAEGLSEEEAQKTIGIIKNFVGDYSKKDKDMTDREWLIQKFRKELPLESEKKVVEFAEQVLETVGEFDQNYKEINEAENNGIDKESWFLNKVKDAATGVGINEFGNHLNGISNTLENANAQMRRTVITQSENISQCMNLDGFIAEQHAVNTFNMQAELDGSPFRAEVCVPEQGKTYGLNSFDVVIKDIASGKIANQYQFKFGKDAKTTISLLKNGNYNNQRFVVPAEQVDEVQRAFPGKTVDACIGGTASCPTKSKPITKEEVKNLQMETQENGVIPRYDWNNYNTKDLVLNIGKNAGLAGIQTALITTGFDMVTKAVSGTPIDGDETVERAIRTGADSGIKAATAGALKVSVEKGYLKLIPQGTPAGVFANIACVSIENIKILLKVAEGELTITQAIDKMAKTSTAMVYGLGWGATGMAVGAAALSFVPVVGPVIGGLVGGVVGYMAGSTVGGAVYEGVKKVGKVAKEVVKSAWNGAKSLGRKAASGIKRIFGR